MPRILDATVVILLSLGAVACKRTCFTAERLGPQTPQAAAVLSPRYSVVPQGSEPTPRPAAHVREALNEIDSADRAKRDVAAQVLIEAGPAITPHLAMMLHSVSDVRAASIARVICAYGEQGVSAQAALAGRMRTCETCAHAFAEALVSTGPGAVPHLASVLAGGSPHARRWAANALGDFGELAASATPLLLAAVRDSTDEELQGEALMALRDMGVGAAGAFPDLLAMWRDPERRFNLEQQIDFAEVLAVLAPYSRAKGSVHVLSSILHDDELSWLVRAAAADGLGRLGDAALEAVPDMRLVLRQAPLADEGHETDEDLLLVDVAIALLRLGTDDPSALAILRDEERFGLSVEESYAAGRACALGGPAARSLAIDLLGRVLDAQESPLRASAARALGMLAAIDQTRVVETLRRAAADHDPAVAETVAAALSAAEG